MKFQDTLENKNETSIITATISWTDIEAYKEKTLVELQKSFESEGFRKGKTPSKVVREKLGEGKLLEEASRNFLNEIYSELIRKYVLRPVIDPVVRLKKAEVGKDWEVIFEIAHAPRLVKNPDVKKVAADMRAQSKKEAIWVPGKDEKPEDIKKQEEKKEDRLQKLMDSLVSKTEIAIAPAIMEQEVHRRLAQLLDEVKKLGMTIDQYFQAKGETSETMRKKLEKEIIDVYTVELLLQQIATDEKISVDEKELEKVFSGIKDDKEQKTARDNAYFYASFLRKQKTLDYLSSL